MGKKDKKCLTVFEHANVHLFNHPESDRYPMSLTIHDVKDVDINTTHHSAGANHRAFKCIKLEAKNTRGQLIEVNLFMASEETV